ncbi:MAG: type II toxin-antitoxin system VapC family toxin [Thermoanaerobaculia bacterium]
MSGWLLDTNVLSELRRPRPNPNVIQFIAAQPFDLLHVSVVTFAEIRFGIEVATDLSQRTELNRWLTHTARPMFANRVLEVTEDILVTWRLLVEGGRKTGYTFAQPDLIIAATALHHGLTMVSRNTRDFEKANVAFLNPWEPA